MTTETLSNDKQLLNCITENNLDEAVTLILEGADVNQPLPPGGPLAGKSLLYAAALTDNYEAAELLLNHGARVTLGVVLDTDDNADCSEDTDQAVCAEAVLRAACADLCPVDPVCGNSSSAILRLLHNHVDLRRICLLNQRELGSTQPFFNLLQYYCTWENPQVSSRRRSLFVRTLVKEVGLAVNSAPVPGVTALYLGCRYRLHPEIVRELLALGAEVNLQAHHHRPIDVLLEPTDDEITTCDDDAFVDTFNLLISHGSSLHHRTTSPHGPPDNRECSYHGPPDIRESLSTHGPPDTRCNLHQGQPDTRGSSHQGRLRGTTLGERVCRANVSFQARRSILNSLIVAGYHLSRDRHLLRDSNNLLQPFKEDQGFCRYLTFHMSNPVSLLAQSRRTIVDHLIDQCWWKISALEKEGLPSMVINYLHFCDLETRESWEEIQVNTG